MKRVQAMDSLRNMWSVLKVAKDAMQIVNDLDKRFKERLNMMNPALNRQFLGEMIGVIKLLASGDTKSAEVLQGSNFLEKFEFVENELDELHQKISSFEKKLTKISEELDNLRKVHNKDMREARSKRSSKKTSF